MVVNAIDFSDLTKKPKPQGFQTPPPQPPQHQMGIKKPDGTVEPAMGYPVNQMGQGDELLQLFPIPVMICPYPTDYSKELTWIRNAETRKENKGIILAPNTGSSLPERFLYPQSEIVSNPNTPSPIPGFFEPTKVNK